MEITSFDNVGTLPGFGLCLAMTKTITSRSSAEGSCQDIRCTLHACHSSHEFLLREWRVEQEEPGESSENSGCVIDLTIMRSGFLVILMIVHLLFR